MTRTAKKTITKKKAKMKRVAKAPVAIFSAPAANQSSVAKEGGPMDISSMDHISGLSGMPTLAAQK